MSTLTILPRVAAELGLCHGVWFAARYATDPDRAVGDETNIVWCGSPTLPSASFVWATDADTPHLTLDLTTVAELLYAAPIDVIDDTDLDALARLVLHEADRWHCDLTGPIALLAQEAGDHPEDCARRMTRCILCAARLLGVSV